MGCRNTKLKKTFQESTANKTENNRTGLEAKESVEKTENKPSNVEEQIPLNSISTLIDEILYLFRKIYFVNPDQKEDLEWFYDIEEILKESKNGKDNLNSRGGFFKALQFLKEKTQWERIYEANETLPQFVNLLDAALAMAEKKSEAFLDYSINVGALDRKYMLFFTPKQVNHQEITDLALLIFPKGKNSKMDWLTFINNFENTFASKNSIVLNEIILENMKKLMKVKYHDNKADYSEFTFFASIAIFNNYELDDFFKYNKII